MINSAQTRAAIITTIKTERKIHMRKIISLLSAMLFAVSAMPFSALPVTAEEESAEADHNCGMNLTWEYDAESYTLTISGAGLMQSWIQAKDVPWYSIAGEIEKIVLPENLMQIGQNAFCGCSALKEINIPHDVSSIPYQAFAGCTALETVVLPDDITLLDACAFESCRELKSIVLPDNLQTIRFNAFQNCTALTDIKLPSGLKTIESAAFRGCSALTEISLPAALTELGDQAFYDCSSLTKISFSNSLTELKTATFKGCSSLTYVKLPDGLISLGEYAFAESGLTEFNAPASLQSVGYRCFMETPWQKAMRDKKTPVILNDILVDGFACSGDVIIPDGIRVIASHAFADAYQMTGITIPDTVTRIEDAAFTGSGLTSVTVPESVTEFGEDVFFLCTKLTEASLPKSLKAIPSGTFSNCYKLRSFPCYVGMTGIGDTAFTDCSQLTDIEIPGSVNMIGRRAFMDCYSLSSVTIRNPYCTISDDEITLPEKTVICGYPDSTAQRYAETYGRTFKALEGDPESCFTYEIVPVLAPINQWFYVKTNNPDPASFRFVDNDSVYDEDAGITYKNSRFADVKYDDAQSLRVNGGFLFAGGTTDGGEIRLQIRSVSEQKTESWIDTDETFTLPTLYSTKDYLIRTYATGNDFFENLNAVQDGMKEISLYSPSYLIGEVYRSGREWYVNRSKYTEQSFQINSPYSSNGNSPLFAASVYPFLYDSLAFPKTIAQIAYMLNPEATFDSVDWGHAYIGVSLNGKGRIYGGAGTVRGHGITSDDITHFFDFSDENLSSITLENMLQIQKDYAETEEATEIPDDEYLTWQSIADTVGSNGAWAKIAGNYTYFYKANDFNYFNADDCGFGSSLYWGGSLSFLDDTWVDGRYINQYSLWEPNADLADHPDSAIALPDVTIPIVTYSYKNEYNQDTQQYESIYDVHDVKEIKMLVCFSFNSHKNCWIPAIV